MSSILKRLKSSNVRHKGEEVGSVETTLQKKLEEVVSVSDKGADSSGVVSANSAFLSAKMKTLIRSGTYKLTNAISKAIFKAIGRVNVVGGGGFWVDASAEKDRFNVSKRAPTYFDCVNYKVGDSWQFDGKLWVANRVTNGYRASWTARRSVADEMQSNSGIFGQWWVRKVNSEYSGPCLKIRNEATGIESDIGFDKDGILDLKRLRVLSLNTRARVVLFYDQSGNGNHLTTSSNDAQPVLEPHLDESGMPRIVFESPLIYNGVAITPQVLDIPVGVSTSSNNLFIGALVKCAHSTRDIPLIEMDGLERVALGKRIQAGMSSVVAYVNNTPKAVTDTVPSLGPEFFSVTSTPSTIRATCGDEKKDYESLPAVDLSGGRIGTSTNLFVDGNGNPRSGGFSLYGITIKKAPILNVSTNEYFALCRDFNLSPQKRGIVVIDGDSITEGAFGSSFRNWPSLVSSEYSAIDTRYFNVAISGGTSTTQIAGKANWLNSFIEKNDRKTAVICFGSNDLKSGVSSVSLFENMQLYLSSVHAAGFNTIVATILPRKNLSAAQEVARLEYNQRLRDEYKSTLGCVAILDFAIESTMGNISNVSNTTYYADGTHPTAFGQELLACYAAEVINLELITGTYR